MVIIYIQNSNNCKENIQCSYSAMVYGCIFVYHLEYWLSDVNVCVCAAIKAHAVFPIDKRMSKIIFIL